jgi:nucleoside-diphosphate-sugar epimerase
MRALPRIFRQKRLLIIGCGDVGLRIATQFKNQFRLIGTARRKEQIDAIRQVGARPIYADLDKITDLRRLASCASWIVQLAPPPNSGNTDPRSTTLARELRRARKNCKIVYVSTTGVYGDSQGAWIDEARLPAPNTERAVRRVAAEMQMLALAQSRIGVTVLRAPGIYALDRLPLARLAKGTPALNASEDVYTNHIHADDLARLCIAALCRTKNAARENFKTRNRRIYNAVDESALKMGEYFDLVAEHFGVSKAPRVSAEQLKTMVSPMMLSFMSESRRIRSERLRTELRIKLRYPTVADFLASLFTSTP